MELDISETTMSNNTDNNSNNNISESNGATNGISSANLKSGYDTDIVRLIGQHLVNIGLKQTVDLLLEESGLNELDHPIPVKFRQHIMTGEWEKANSMSEDIANYSRGDKKTNINEIKLLIAEQKFLELIEDNQHIKALKCLRLEITPLISDTKRIQYLTTLLMCKSIDEVRFRANWFGKGQQSRQNLFEKFQRFIPPLMMLPPRRLTALLSQAVQLQRENCNLHIPNADSDSDSEYVDLKTDHICTPDKFPLNARQQLDNHKAEVWYCKFSNDGTKLATGGLGGLVKIWDLDPITKKLNERCTLDCRTYSISCLSWSPNDVYLLACGSEDTPNLWLWNLNEEREKLCKAHDENENYTTCSWHMSGEKFAAASVKGNFYIYDLDGNKAGNRDGVRVQCLSFLHKDPDVILAADSLNRIKSYAIQGMSLETDEDDILEERHPIMSFTIDSQDHYIAVNLMEQGVHLWDYKLKTMLRMFPGVCQRNFTIYSSFSSPKPIFLASGSEGKFQIMYCLFKKKSSLQTLTNQL